ncbi:ufm1-specific protease 2-like [Haliotis rufescens]|uniref:ufm1-specific protease 2-like n=1 Tax=Haliotis rufescens TaxID=6454 RepID=UPI00201F05DE|nr:ufm1-specific protease 2-like [Haliotis rufescens]
MAASVLVQERLLNLLRGASWKHKGFHGFIVGRQNESAVEALFSTYCGASDEKVVTDTTRQSQQLLPGGLELCGVIVVTDTEAGPANTRAAVQAHISNKLLETLGEKPLIVCHVQLGSGQLSTNNFLLLDTDQEVLDCQVSLTRDDVLASSVVFRLQAHVPITVSIDSSSKDWQQAINCEMGRVCRSLQSPACVYSVKNTRILLTSSEVKGVSGDQSCEVLYQHIESDDDVPVSRSKKRGVKDQGPLGVELLLLVSEEVAGDVPCCAPVVHHNIGDFKAVKMLLPLDVLSVIKSDESIENLHAAFTTAVKSQLESMKDCLCQYKQGEKFHIPEAFHFRPGGGPSFITHVYPQTVPDEEMESQRRDLHHLLMLPADRPLFRRANQYMFPGQPTAGGYLLNPHTGLPAGGVGTQYLVEGTYSYHHYMQDRFNDNQWGCAYRSLQTLVSWFRFQGYTDKSIPTHKEIQQALVDIGDKEKSFVGSRKWIGSLEVGYCLDQLIGVTCKIMNVSSGGDLASKGRELASHFTHQGTPIMIGGGVLAHTILGVDFDEVTGNIRFLILDPHYTESEDLKVILDKGWCGWKGPDFWEVNSHYNLCMPQRPQLI